MTRELLQQALDDEFGIASKALRAEIEAYLAEPMPEPVALMELDDINELMHCNGMNVFVENPRIYPPYCEGEPLVGFVPLYFAPPAAPAPVVPNWMHKLDEILSNATVSRTDSEMVDAARLALKEGWALSAAPVVREPLTDEQVAAGIKAWFTTEIAGKNQPFEGRMRAAYAAIIGIGGGK